ncbi:Ada metal-binding domain-containing protein [Mitsuokella sp. WILCCON 0060]
MVSTISSTFVGPFCPAVLVSKIYCVSSCVSRLPSM